MRVRAATMTAVTTCVSGAGLNTLDAKSTKTTKTI